MVNAANATTSFSVGASGPASKNVSPSASARDPHSMMPCTSVIDVHHVQSDFAGANHDEMALLYGPKELQESQITFSIDCPGSENGYRLSAADRGCGFHLGFQLGHLIDIVRMHAIGFVCGGCST